MIMWLLAYINVSDLISPFEPERIKGAPQKFHKANLPFDFMPVCQNKKTNLPLCAKSLNDELYDTHFDSASSVLEAEYLLCYI